jgi:hypothetical protein
MWPRYCCEYLRQIIEIQIATFMKANIKNDEYPSDDLVLTEPHFDDEQTVLSARPVVPLSQIKERELQGKHRTFGLAIAFSLLLGLVSATMIYRQRQQKPSAEVINAAEPGAFPTNSPENFPSAGIGTLSDSSSPSLEPTAEILNSTAERDTLLAKAPTRKPVRVERVAKRAKQLQPEAPPETRDRRARGDGAWRIREIFEGSRRP